MSSRKPEPKKPDSKKPDPKAAAGKGGGSKEKPKSAEELRQEAWDTFVQGCLETHGGWLATPISNLSKTFSVDPVTILLFASIPALILLLLSPATWVPHIAAPFTLLIPIQNTMRSIALETKKGRNKAVDSPQWVMYWVVWVVLTWLDGWMNAFRPGWKAAWAVWRVCALVVVGGPWFGKASLRGPPPSKELQEAEKREADEAEREAKAEARKKEQDDQPKEGKDKERDKDKDDSGKDKKQEKGKDDKADRDKRRERPREDDKRRAESAEKRKRPEK